MTFCDNFYRMLNVVFSFLYDVEGAEPQDGEEEAHFITRDVKYLKEVVVAKDPPVVQVFDVVEHGRRFYRTLTFSSDASLSLVSRPPSGVSIGPELLMLLLLLRVWLTRINTTVRM